MYQLAPDLALVATVDFITPVVDDPERFGAVAAANALSDVYAMGGKPIFALNVVNFPRGELPLTVLEQVLAGGASKTAEAGIPILGGHSIDDLELKYGMVVLGTVNPSSLITNAGAHEGDVLILTKPIGIGLATTAIKAGQASDAAIAEALTVMTTLNRAAAEAMIEVGCHAATDVTGFGLLGHLAEMTRASGVTASISASSVPVLSSAPELLRAGMIPGGTRRNLEAVSASVDWDPIIPEETRLLLADAQTSGGLLIAVAPERAEELCRELGRRGALVCATIGQFVAGPGRIQVAP